VELATQRLLVSRARVGRLATVTASGMAHVVPVCFALVDDVVYSAVDNKPKRSANLRRIANIVATGSTSLLVDHFEEDWSMLWWVRLDGTGRLVDHDDEARAALAALTAKYQQYQQRPPDGAIIAIDVQHWTSWSAS
jgi:PPOX class probable F420-dependent enzyme